MPEDRRGRASGRRPGQGGALREQGTEALHHRSGAMAGCRAILLGAVLLGTLVDRGMWAASRWFLDSVPLWERAAEPLHRCPAAFPPAHPPPPPPPPAFVPPAACCRVGCWRRVSSVRLASPPPAAAAPAAGGQGHPQQGPMGSIAGREQQGPREWAPAPTCASGSRRQRRRRPAAAGVTSRLMKTTRWVVGARPSRSCYASQHAPRAAHLHSRHVTRPGPCTRLNTHLSCP